MFGQSLGGLRFVLRALKGREMPGEGERAYLMLFYTMKHIH